MMYKITALFLLLFGLMTANALAQYKTEMVVAKDGSGDYKTIQAAIDDTKSFPSERITIYIKDGIYKEKVKVHSWNTKLSLIGESKENTIIRFDDYFDRINRGRNSTFFTYTVLVEANDFHAENLTIENTAGAVGQAVALHIDADRVSIKKSRIVGNQDTVFVSGEGARQYFKDCYIEGTTDFIFGEATAVFENCTLHSKGNSYITAASTPESSEYGLVFKNCRLTAAEGVTKVYLGRPWRDFARTVFLNSNMGDHIIPEGWHNWGKPEAETTVFYGEYGNTGSGFKAESRVDWSHILTKEQAQTYTLDEIFGDWNPAN